MNHIGSDGERRLQIQLGTTERAARFYSEQVLDHLNSTMIDFIARQHIAFVATADAKGECDNSLRAGDPGFIRVIDSNSLAYPEYRGNGVMASLGNIVENPHVGLILVDFVHDLIGLHINGSARIVADSVLRSQCGGWPVHTPTERAPELWVVVTVEEAYIHCRKHIPRMAPVPSGLDRGFNENKPKGGDYFGSKSTRRYDADSVSHR